eukprot:gene5616-6988_t
MFLTRSACSLIKNSRNASLKPSLISTLNSSVISPSIKNSILSSSIATKNNGEDEEYVSSRSISTTSTSKKKKVLSGFASRVQSLRKHEVDQQMKRKRMKSLVIDENELDDIGLDDADIDTADLDDKLNYTEDFGLEDDENDLGDVFEEEEQKKESEQKSKKKIDKKSNKSQPQPLSSSTKEKSNKKDVKTKVEQPTPPTNSKSGKQQQKQILKEEEVEDEEDEEEYDEDEEDEEEYDEDEEGEEEEENVNRVGGRYNKFGEDKDAVDDEISREFWARQMALRESIKKDGGLYLLNEESYQNNVSQYKKLGKKLMNQHKIDKLKDKEEGISTDYFDDNDGLPDFTRLDPYSPIPASPEIVDNFFEKRKQELLKKSDEAADEFERQRKIKRIEFMAKKKLLQKKQAEERARRLGIVELGDDEVSEIDAKVFGRFQRGEITEEEMLEISRQQALENENNDDFDEEGRSKKNYQYLQHWKIGSIEVNPLLKKKIAQSLKNYSTEQLRMDAAQLSNNLRNRTRTEKPTSKSPVVIKPEEKPVIIYGKGQVLAYIAHRMPGVYGCIKRVFHEISTRFPSFKPDSMLDFGSGPGTALWAAKDVWGQSISKYEAVEPSSFMIDVAKKMLEGQTNNMKWSQFMPTRPSGPNSAAHWESQQKDLVVASYVLSELPDAETRSRVVIDLWEQVKPSGVLVLLEPGTPVGFGIIKEMRQMVLDLPSSQVGKRTLKAQVLSPCPHSGQCPMGNLSWCHFSQRVVRPVFQKLAKGSVNSVPFEDEKYSYIVLTKVTESSIPSQLEKQETIYGNSLEPKQLWSRLVDPPYKRGGHVIMDVCTPEEDIRRVTVAKSHGKQMYREARKSFWSDGFIIDESHSHWIPSRMETIIEEPTEEELKKKSGGKKVNLLDPKNKIEKNVELITEDSKPSKKETKQQKRDVKKQDEWMNELGDSDRKLLKKLMTEGKFQVNEDDEDNKEEGEDYDLDDETPISNNSNPYDNASDDYGSREMQIEFEGEKVKKPVVLSQLKDSSRAAKDRRERIQKDLQTFKLQNQNREPEEEQKTTTKRQSKISDPIKRLLKEEEDPGSTVQPLRSASLAEFKTEMAKKLESKSGLGVNSKNNRQKWKDTNKGNNK